MQGADQAVVEAFRRGDVAAAPLEDRERVLFEYVEKLTRRAHQITADDVARLRAAGWTDEQIAETVYVTALFALFNRVADAFGLVDPQYSELAASGRQAPAPAVRYK